MRTGIHILAALEGCPRELTEESDVVLKLLNEIVSEAKLHKVGETAYQFQPHGATAVILLAESHISVHTWPEKNGFAAIDIFTCGKKEKARDSFSILLKKFKPQKVKTKEVKR